LPSRLTAGRRSVNPDSAVRFEAQDFSAPIDRGAERRRQPYCESEQIPEGYPPPPANDGTVTENNTGGNARGNPACQYAARDLPLARQKRGQGPDGCVGHGVPGIPGGTR